MGNITSISHLSIKKNKSCHSQSSLRVTGKKTEPEGMEYDFDANANCKNKFLAVNMTIGYMETHTSPE